MFAGTSMSLLGAVEEAIRTCKDAQSTLEERVELYRHLLRSLKPQPHTAREESAVLDDAASDTVADPVENEDMKLLEEALEKALRVRTGAELSKRNLAGDGSSGARKEVTAASATHKEARQPSAVKANQTSQNGKKHRNPGSSVSHQLGRCKTAVHRNIVQRHPASSTGTIHRQAPRKSPHAISATHDCHPDVSSFQAKNRAASSNVPSGNNVSKSVAETTEPSNSRVPVSHTDQSHQQHGISSELASKWKSHRVKQSRLWDRVMAAQKKPVPERSRFMERMTAQFPGDWPRGSPDQTRALLHRLTLQGHELAHRCQTKELLAQQNPEGATELDDKGNKYDSRLTFERLQMTAVELHDFADQVKHEWDAWDRWRPEGGCLCPTGATVEMEEGVIAPLPQTVTYTGEGELRELEGLRMRVALLQQELLLEQALIDTLSPRLASIVPGYTNPSVLRDLYSLLGEGGQRFPAIVLDPEPD